MSAREEERWADDWQGWQGRVAAASGMARRAATAAGKEEGAADEGGEEGSGRRMRWLAATIEEERKITTLVGSGDLLHDIGSKDD
ncbi:hypothetical protein GW17_00008284 [Ensete ventricosum]|nr:hypothetical protein GW17_00008284 [Ensete ventricosum]